jgi:hypothetical protein
VCCGFLSPLKNSSPWPGFEPATFGSSGKHTNNYTTNATAGPLQRRSTSPQPFPLISRLTHATTLLYVIIYIKQYNGRLGSSGSIVSDYRLHDRAIEVRFPAEAKNFPSSLCVQTGSGAHPASCPIGTGGPLTGVQCGRGVTLTTHPHLVPRS